MSHSRYVRCSAALVVTLFANATLAAPGVESGLLGSGQRFGVDQDGNVVRLEAAVTRERVQPPPAPPAVAAGSVRYGVNQNGELRPVTATAALPPPSPLTPPHPRFVATVTARLKGVVVTVSRGGRSLVARLSPGAATASTSAGAAPAVAPPPSPVPAAAPPSPPHRTAPSPRPTAGSAGSRSVRATPAGSPLPGSRAPAPDPCRFTLKIDTRTVEAGALPVEEKLAREGVTVLTAKKERAPRTIHRLVIGTFATEAEARTCLRDVQPQVKQAYLMSHNGVHGVYCGSYYDLEKAQEKAREVTTAGITVTIRRDSVAALHTTILAGVYRSRDEADTTSRRLRGLGIPAAIVPGTESLAELTEKSDNRG